MATTQELINSLKQDKINLVNMLNSMGVEADNNETFTSLTPKVGKIVTDPILQDKSVEITENGTQIITADEGYDGLNNVSVTTNIASSGGEAENSSLNVFLQEEEPETKDGIWIKHNDISIDDIRIEQFNTLIEWAYNVGSTPVGTAYNRVVKYQNYLYVFGGRNSSGTPVNTAYKYDLLTNTYTFITSLPTPTIAPAIGIVGKKIYLFGGQTSSSGGYTSAAYVYDIDTDSYSSITNLPYSATQIGSVYTGTDIYLTGGSTNAGNFAYAYKYDTLTDTYTKLTNMPTTYAAHAPVYKDGYIYTFTGLQSGYQQISFKYNIENDEYTMITSYPIKMGHGSAGVVGDDIYVFSGYYNSSTPILKVYKYDTKLNSYTALPDLEKSHYNAGYVSDGSIVYFVNGETTGNSTDLSTVTKFGYITGKTYDTNTLVIATDEDTYSTKIFDNVTVSFDKIIHYDVVEQVTNRSLDTYYGDGTQWIKF